MKIRQICKRLPFLLNLLCRKVSANYMKIKARLGDHVYLWNTGLCFTLWLTSFLYLAPFVVDRSAEGRQVLRIPQHSAGFRPHLALLLQLIAAGRYLLVATIWFRSDSLDWIINGQFTSDFSLYLIVLLSYAAVAYNVLTFTFYGEEIVILRNAVCQMSTKFESNVKLLLMVCSNSSNCKPFLC